MSTPSHDDDSSSDLGPAVSHPVPTPRGGFMARPGLKTPPRHAVVVRVGNVPVSDEIPVARSSAPPPPPVETATQAAGPISSSDKVTVPALRTPQPPAVRADNSERPTVPLRTLLPPPPDTAHALESIPPPSDAPVATSVRTSKPPTRPARRRSSWPIVIAAAVGLVLGLVSIATSTSARRGAAQASLPEPATQELPAAAPRPLPSVRAVAPKAALPTPEAMAAPSARSAQPAVPRKKSIF